MKLYLCPEKFFAAMIISMTGFGKSEYTFNRKKISIDVKSVNSKQLDLNIKLPPPYRMLEGEIRSRVLSRLGRGKVDVFVSSESLGAPGCGGESTVQLNEAQIGNYFDQLKSFCRNRGIEAADSELLGLALRMPDTTTQDKNDQTDEELPLFCQAIDEALQHVEAFRIQEGLALHRDLEARIALITSHLDAVEPFEAQRIETCRTRLRDALNKEVGENNVDLNRFEQEIIFYLEKLDVTEEKVRLRNHCNYFLKTMQDEASAGKKLGFIIQEIGREINTLGSKANELHIQQLVVRMKDELEKIREQSMNIL